MVLELINVTKNFGKFQLGPLSLTVNNKDVMVILGPTGSGKTTLINLIAGILRPDNGKIYNTRISTRTEKTILNPDISGFLKV